MTTEKYAPLSARAERALKTDSLEELEQLLATWPPAAIEELSQELETVYTETRERIHQEYERDRAAAPCLRQQRILDACYGSITARADFLYHAVAAVVLLGLEEARRRQS